MSWPAWVALGGVWTILAFAAGIRIGRAIRNADRRKDDDPKDEP